MDLIMISAVSLMTALACLIFAFRVFNFKMLMRAHWMVDIVVTAALMMFFAGTLQGTVIAAMAGLLFSIFMTTGRLAQKGTQYVKTHRPTDGVRIANRDADEARRAKLDEIMGLLKPAHERKHGPRVLGHQRNDYGFMAAPE